ncbi:MAG: PHP domain-containing protein [Armatimonadota bacterium]
MPAVNPFDAPGEWYKGNLHAHTTESDGELSPAQACARYREAGYSFLAITDHGKVSDTRHLREADGFVTILGAEYGGPGAPSDHTYHIVVLDVPADWSRPSDDAQEIINAANAAGALAFIAHPYWSGLHTEDVLALRNHMGVEVYNYTCYRGIGKGNSAIYWDVMLARGVPAVGIAVDDSHGHYDDYLGGWVSVKAEELTPESVLTAIRSRAFYASSGPDIYDFRIVGGKAVARCSPAQAVNFICANSRGKSTWRDDETLFCEAEVELTGRERYVRLEVVDARGRIAWSNPLPVPFQ